MDPDRKTLIHKKTSDIPFLMPLPTLRAALQIQLGSVITEQLF